MTGIKELHQLIHGMTPVLNKGEYVFVSVQDISQIEREKTICEFREKEGTTVVLSKSYADELKLTYDFVASWITLEIHSSLEAVGLTAAFSAELAKNNISCNVVAGFYHDHIFVPVKDSEKAIRVLTRLSENGRLK
ncbi:MAG: ACT domain-containing protein [Draconibacterium sp.]